MLKLLLLLATLSWVVAEPDASAAELMWKSRPLIVFVSGSGSDELKTQKQLFKELDSELQDRDMKLLVVTGDQHPWRERFDITDRSFEVVLVGKDGGVKMRATKPLDPKDVFGTIDQMPMRRREMRESHKRE